jgi:DnaK suppressor protein
MDPDDPVPGPSADPAAMRAALLEERQRALDELSETVQAPGQMTYGSQAAAASQVFAQQRDLALHDRSQAQLELVDAALARLADGSYGICLRCGSPIAAGRLEALPWAAHCIACQAIVDRERR